MRVAESNGFNFFVVRNFDELRDEDLVDALFAEAELTVLCQPKCVQLLRVLRDESRVPGASSDTPDQLIGG